MNDLTDHTCLHRTAKYFMDTGRAASHGEAMELLGSYGLSIHVGTEVRHSAHHQIALLTLINLARRTLLAGVEVIGLGHAPLLVPLAPEATLAQAAQRLGARISDRANPAWPATLIGSCETHDDAPATWHLTWSGWRGGATPAHHGVRLTEHGAIELAPALAAAVCAAEAFAWHAGDHPMAGRRAAGVSLWMPGRDWLADDAEGPGLYYLPSRLWLIGLGNLGQAFAWLLACLPYQDRAAVELVLQDYDRLADSNDSTSVLSSLALTGQMKTRVISAWLEAAGFTTALEERRFGAWTRRAPHEPAVGLCGVDNGPTRADLGKAGFDLIIEAGLGSGPAGFRNFSMHTFPASRRPEETWPARARENAIDVARMPAYEELRKSGLDACGLAQLASRTVGVPFVGMIAGAIAISESLRRLNGGTAFELVSGSALSLNDVESVALAAGPYAFGHLPAAEFVG